jgi:DNA-directed RNA polymerase subunit RPC12/RpoP
MPDEPDYSWLFGDGKADAQGNPVCPGCGSKDLEYKGSDWVMKEFRCRRCGRYFNINTNALGPLWNPLKNPLTR